MKSSHIVASRQLSTEQINELRTLSQQCHGQGKMYWSILQHERPQVTMFLYYNGTQLQGFFTFYLFDKIECTCLTMNNINHNDFFDKLLTSINTYIPIDELQPFLLSRIHGEQAPSPNANLKYSEFNMQRRSKEQIPFTSSAIMMRPANASDANAIVNIDQTCFATPSTTLESRLSTLLIDPGYYIGMAELNQHVIGKIHLQFEANKAIIYDFAILPAYQGKGYGSSLLKLAINLCLVKNIDTIELDVEVSNTNAITLYQKCGFSVIKGYDFWSIKQLTDLKEEKG